VLVDADCLQQINSTESIAIARVRNFQFAMAGQRVATIKTVPFAVTEAQLKAVLRILRERGPILQARPICQPAVGILYTDPVDGNQARTIFKGCIHQPSISTAAGRSIFFALGKRRWRWRARRSGEAAQWCARRETAVFPEYWPFRIPSSLLTLRVNVSIKAPRELRNECEALSEEAFL
jgi:hypothetical protein